MQVDDTDRRILRHWLAEPGLERAEVREIREQAWEEAVQAALRAATRPDTEPGSSRAKQAWKRALAIQVRRDTGASWAWLARRLGLGTPAALRSHFCRCQKAGLQQRTA